MLSELLCSPLRGGVYNEINTSVCDGLPIAIFGVCEREKARLVGTIKQGSLVIVKDVLTAKKLADDITLFTGEKAVFLPPKDEVLLYKPI